MGIKSYRCNFLKCGESYVVLCEIREEFICVKFSGCSFMPLYYPIILFVKI